MRHLAALILMLTSQLALSDQAPTHIKPRLVQNSEPVVGLITSQWKSIYSSYGTRADLARVDAPSKIYALGGKCRGVELYAFSDLDVRTIGRDGAEYHGYSGGGSGGYPVVVLGLDVVSQRLRVLLVHSAIDLVGLSDAKSACPDLWIIFNGAQLGRAGNDYGYKKTSIDRVTGSHHP